MGVFWHNFFNVLIYAVEVWLAVNLALLAILVFAVVFRIYRKLRISAYDVIWTESSHSMHQRSASSSAISDR